MEKVVRHLPVIIVLSYAEIFKAYHNNHKPLDFSRDFDFQRPISIPSWRKFVIVSEKIAWPRQYIGSIQVRYRLSRKMPGNFST